MTNLIGDRNDRRHLDSRLRGNDDDPSGKEVGDLLWIPAFAGMTTIHPAKKLVTSSGFPPSRE
jgi:hypothetical protein